LLLILRTTKRIWRFLKKFSFSLTGRTASSQYHNSTKFVQKFRTASLRPCICGRRHSNPCKTKSKV